MFSQNERDAVVNEQPTLDAAIRVLRDHGLAADIAAGPPLAATIASAGCGARTYAVEVRERMSAEVASAIHGPSDQPLLGVAPHIGDAAADVLRARGIDFVDGSGNVHLAWDAVLIDVRGRRRAAVAPRHRSPAASRAFTRSGAQVVFVLLSWPKMAARPLREIARASGVSLGTAQIVIDDLTGAGYLYEGPDGRTLARAGELLSRWAEAYALWLAPKLHLATFAVDDPRWWEGADIELADAGVQLGGELAASLLDPHLRPTTATLYAETIPATLIARWQMRRDEQDGTVFVRRRFWRLPEDVPRLVPTPLIYGDLVASGDPRQREHAERLRGHDDRLTRLDRS